MASKTFRVYADEETMLKVYARRLGIADAKHDRGAPEREHFVKRYRGELDEDQITDEGHRVSVTQGVAIIDTMFSSMTAVDVEYGLKAIGHGTRAQVLTAQQAMNQTWRDTKGQRRTKRAIKDALLTDIGWVKVYYDYQEDVTLADKPDEALKAEILDVAEQTGKTPQQVVDDGDVKAVEQQTIIVRDRVCVDYVKWDHVRYDPGAKYIEDVRWVAQYTRMPVPEVTRNPQYRAFVEDRYGVTEGQRLLDDLEGDSVVSTGLEGSYDDIEGLGTEEDDDDVRVTVVEMWDFETGLVTVYPRNQTDLILHQRLNPLMFNPDLEERNPFKPLIVRDDPENLEGLGDMRVIFPALEEMDEYRSNIAEHVSRSIPKVVGPARAFSAQGKKAFESQVWGEYVGLEEGHSYQELGFPQPAPLTQEVYGVPQTIQNEMRDATGANEVFRGVFTDKRTTATETQYVAEGGERRQAERRSTLEEWYADIGRTMLQLMQLFYTAERMARFTDDAGNEFEWAWNEQDIAMEMDLDIQLTPHENLTRDQRVERALRIGNLGLALPEFDRGEWLKFTYEEMGLDPETVRRLVKTDKEVKIERQQATIEGQLAAKPQPFADSPSGISVAPSG